MPQRNARLGAGLALLALAIGSAASAAELWEFTGTSCGACRQMDPIVAQVQAQGVPIRRVDVQQDAPLARQFGVQYIPCFVAVADGRPVDRLTGIVTAQQLFELYRRAAELSPPPAVVRGQSAPRPASSVLPVRAVAHDSRPPATSLSPAEQRALAATVRLKVVDPQGQSYGTGTIVHAHGEEALVLTCGHIFRESAGRGEVLCDLFVNGEPREIPARLVSFDLRRDVGLISLRPGGQVTPVRIGGTGNRQRPGDPVFAIGCSHGNEPTIHRNQILAVNRYHGPANLVVGGRPVDGRSGGGLFDATGTLIGVCNAADQTDDEGLYAALGPIHAELDDSGLGFIYRSPTTPSTPEPAVPVVGQLASLSAPPASTPPAQTTQAEPPREVIVIFRQKGESGLDGQAFVLDHPSDRLLQVLSGELAQRGAHETTGLHVPLPQTASQRVTAEQPAVWRPLP